MVGLVEMMLKLHKDLPKAKTPYIRVAGLRPGKLAGSLWPCRGWKVIRTRGVLMSVLAVAVCLPSIGLAQYGRNGDTVFNPAGPTRGFLS
jgi:hypothetical protein